MKIVVTGALGHIGSQLIRTLPIEFPGAEIVLLDNLLTQRYCSLFNLPTVGRYRFLETDLENANLTEVLNDADVVVHLAAITDATQSFRNREEVERVNYHETLRLAKACVDADCALVFPSTTSVYGVQSEEVDEACSVVDLKPQSPYAEAKLRSELYLLKLGRETGLRFSICRFGTIFGTSIGMRFHTAVNKFCWQAIMGQPLTIWETALHQARPYLDLDDAVSAISYLLSSSSYDNQIYNIVTTNATVSEIVGIITERIPAIEVEYVQTEIMNQLSYRVSNKRFVALGFEFRGSLVQGIDKTLGQLRMSNDAAISNSMAAASALSTA